MKINLANNGFTLIEIVAIVAIISILAGALMMRVGTHTVDTRDSRRKTELAMLHAALIAFEYARDAYPSTGDVWYTSEPGDGVLSNNGGNWIPGLVPNFISKLPRDPRGGTSTAPAANCANQRRAYRYRSNGNNGFKLMSRCSAEGMPMSNTDELFDPAHPNEDWMICSGETACTW